MFYSAFRETICQKTTLQLGNCLHPSDLQNLSKVATFFLDSMSTTGVGQLGAPLAMMAQQEQKLIF